MQKNYMFASIDFCIRDTNYIFFKLDYFQIYLFYKNLKFCTLFFIHSFLFNQEIGETLRLL